VLVHAFPDATVPVIQLSIDANKELEEHVDLGARLAPLRERGVLIIGSGNVVHNLGGLDPRRPDEGFDWSQAFDDAAERLMTTDPGAIPSLRGHDAFSAAVPTPDHFLPLLYIAGLAAAAGTTANTFVKGYALGSLSMTSYTVGAWFSRQRLCVWQISARADRGWPAGSCRRSVHRLCSRSRWERARRRARCPRPRSGCRQSHSGIWVS